ncbi:MAG: DHA2 family efflux MFS transporter permease subunit [Massilibacteroides sp.]|nr:DHA2 family efflux MFS transporter permease subunit [Massilibacteroides sp.]
MSQIIKYPTGFSRAIIVITCIAASLLELVDTTIVNVSLKHIAGSIGASTTDVAWVITAYAISNVIIIPMSSMLTELFGRRTYFTFSIALFTFASFMCGNSNTLIELVIWRFIQGLGGGALLSLSQSILMQSFPPEKVNLASSIYGMGVALGPALGPTLGGIITDNYSWQWIFYVNIPIGILAIITSWMYVRDQVERIKPIIDWLGIIFLAVGIGAFQYVLEEGNSKNWFEDKNIVILSIVSVVGIISLVIRELNIKNPVVNLSLLKSKNLSIGIILNFCMMAILFISIYTFPLFVQMNLGWTASMTGIALIPGAIVSAIGMVVCQKLMAKGANPTYLIMAGFAACFVFSFEFARQSPDSSWWGLFSPLIFRGISVGLYMLPAITMAVTGFSGRDLGQAVGLSNMARQLGGAVGLALIGTQITNTQASTRVDLISNISDYKPAAAEAISQMNGLFQANGFDGESAHNATNSILNMQVLQQSSILSYLESFRVMAIVSVIAFMLLLFTRKLIAQKINK